MSFQDGDSETLLVTPMGQNLYRMEESSLLGEVSYHDVVEAEPQPDGLLRFLRVSTPSELKRVSWMLPPSLTESPNLSVLLGKVLAAGGNWERVFGGCLIVHLPPAEFDTLVQDFENLFRQFANEPPVQ